MTELAPVIAIARKEFWDRIRNRWVLGIALVFAAFALVIAYFGAAQRGRSASAAWARPSRAS